MFLHLVILLVVHRDSPTNLSVDQNYRCAMTRLVANASQDRRLGLDSLALMKLEADLIAIKLNGRRHRERTL